MRENHNGNLIDADCLDRDFLGTLFLNTNSNPLASYHRNLRFFSSHYHESNICSSQSVADLVSRAEDIVMPTELDSLDGHIYRTYNFSAGIAAYKCLSKNLAKQYFLRAARSGVSEATVWVEMINEQLLQFSPPPASLNK